MIHPNPASKTDSLSLIPKLNVGFDFTTTSSSSGFLSSIFQFDMVLFFFEKKWSEMVARRHRKIHDVKQWENMIPLITGEVAFRQHVCKLVFGVNIFDMDLCWSKLILSNSQSSATLRVRDTCHIVGLLPLMIILITASLPSEKYTAGLRSEKVLRL